MVTSPLVHFFITSKTKNFFFDDEEILLTRRESKIFEILMLAKGDVVPKQSLMNHVWGIDFDGDPNIVHVYIGYLRQKISDKQNKQNKQVLQTVRGIGYRLVDEIKE